MYYRGRLAGISEVKNTISDISANDDQKWKYLVINRSPILGNDIDNNIEELKQEIELYSRDKNVKIHSWNNLGLTTCFSERPQLWPEFQALPTTRRRSYASR